MRHLNTTEHMGQPTGRTLAAVGRQIRLPLELQVTGGHDPSSNRLKLDALFRVLPGTRLAGRSDWRNTAVLVKLFYNPRHWRRHVKRELKGHQLITEAGILTPRLVDQLYLASGDGGLLLYEYLEEGKSINTIWKDLEEDAERMKLLHSVIDVIALCHDRGLMQSDMHPDNFLLNSGEVYLLDAAAVKATGNDARTRILQCMSNFARFIAQFPVSNDANAAASFDYYRSRRSKESNGFALTDFLALVVQERRLRIRSYQRKLLRSTTEHEARAGRSCVMVWSRTVSPECRMDLARDPDRIMGQGKVIKAGNSSTVALVHLDNKDRIIKRYNIKNPGHGLKRLFTTSRARRSWQSAHMLLMLGIETPEPLMMMEHRRLGIFGGRAYYVSEYINAPDVITVLRQSGVEHREAILKHFERLFQVMKHYRISHGDMKASNFLYANDCLYVLDLDAMRIYRSDGAFKRHFRKDLSRWLKNWSGFVEIEKAARTLVDRMMNFR